MKQLIHAHLAKKLRTHDFTPLDVLAYGASCFDKVEIFSGFVRADGNLYVISKDRPLEETILYAVAGNTGLELERK